MKIIKKILNYPGIYVIKNIINNKVYVGKSKNCYKRLHQHLSDIRINNRNRNENPHLLNAFKKYGENNFECYIIEQFDKNDYNLENKLYEQELYWMKELDSLNKEKGYNLRFDSNGKCYCSDETKLKISKRSKNDWLKGCHKNHSNKLKLYWLNNNKRKLEQSKLFSSMKTKYIYIIYDYNDILITNNGDFNILKKIGLDKAAFSYFSKHKTNYALCKNYKIIRIYNKDIVHPKKKFLEK